MKNKQKTINEQEQLRNFQTVENHEDQLEKKNTHHTKKLNEFTWNFKTHKAGMYFLSFTACV